MLLRSSFCLMLLLIPAVETATAPQIVAEQTSTQSNYVHPNYYKQGQSVSFKCIAEGEPAPTYEWFHDGEMLDSNIDVRVILSDAGNLKINKLDYQKDDGMYQCVASNKYGRDVSEIIKFKVTVSRTFKPPNTQKDPVQMINATIGKPLLVPCPLYEYVYPRVYSWAFVKDRSFPEALKEDSRVVILSNGTLSVGYVEEEDITSYNDNGGIHCVIYAGFSTVISNGFKLNKIDGKATDFPPVFVDKISGEKRTIKGSIVNFYCLARGRPPPVMTWYHNNKLITNTMTGYKLSKNNIVLDVTVDNDKKAGVYTCQSKNIVDGKEKKIVANFTLIVDEKPQWMVMLKDQVVDPGSHIHLSCVANGVPKPTYEWYSGSKKLVTTYHNGSIANDGFLEIKNATGTTSYECHASNRHGKIIATSIVSAMYTTTTPTTVSTLPTATVKTATKEPIQPQPTTPVSNVVKDGRNYSSRLAPTTVVLWLFVVQCFWRILS